MFQVCSVDIAFADVRQQESRKAIFVRWSKCSKSLGPQKMTTNYKSTNSRFHEQDLRMSVWKSRSVAKKAGLYMEEWLTALRSFHS